MELNRIYLNNGWQYFPCFSEDLLAAKLSDATLSRMEEVRLPHTVYLSSYNGFSAENYQMVSAYRRTLLTSADWQEKHVLLTVGAAAHYSEVYLNGTLLATHSCGYTAFTVDLSKALAPVGKENVLVIKVDSRESLNEPPFGFVVDYMTYGGIYRDVYLEVKPSIYIEDIFVHTKGAAFYSEVTLSSAQGVGLVIHQTVLPDVNAPVVGSADNPCAEITTGVMGAKALTQASATGVEQWSLETPALYCVHTELLDANGRVIDKVDTRFGFRDIRFDSSGFYLNGKKIKIRGLNRHQSFAYVGYAVPRSIERDDADILKYELGLNEVRTSHYPQGEHFVNRCDEIGLLVFTEIPGWQHIGNGEWKEQAVRNVQDMVVQYRNHPSVFLWGVRINESQDDDELYTRTNELCRSLDPYRPTGGVRYIKNSSLLEDVYTFNDFSHTGNNAGILPKAKVTRSKKGYMVTEYNGHMFPTKTFDSEAHRTEHALRHAAVLDAVAKDDAVAGSSGWCAFDYNTHKDFGSGDYICYHGVMDMFRNPKSAAFVYQSQEEPSVVGNVLFISSSMDIGEYPAGDLGKVYAFTNAESVRLYVGNTFVKEFFAKDSACYKHLPHPPLLIDDFIGNRPVTEDGIPKAKLAAAKKLLFAIRGHGLLHLPLSYKILALWLGAYCRAGRKKITSLYEKYIAGWGRQAEAFRFEAVRNGKVVCTVVKEAVQNVHLKAIAAREQLIEEESYDMVLVRLRAVDQNGNVQPFFQEAVSLSVEGPIELVGPCAVSLKGGMAGCFVRTLGVAGNARLIVEDWQNRKLFVDFTVKITKNLLK